MAMTSSSNSRSSSASLAALPTASATASGPSFTTVQRGYHKGEVDEFVDWAWGEIKRAGQAAEHLVAREARSPQGQKLMVEVLQIVADEALGQQTAADQQIAELLAGAEQQAAQIIADARQQAADTHASASSQATSLINNARAEAKRMTDEATARAAAVDEAAGQRMARFAKLHEDGMDRVRQANATAAQVQEVTGKLLQAEAERGPLADEVVRVMAQAGIPPQPQR